MRCNFVGGTVTGSSVGPGFTQSVKRDVGPGFQWVTVVLTGWGLDCHEGDGVRRVRIQVSAPEFAPEAGSVTFTVSGELDDRRAVDGYRWSVSYTVLAFGGGVHDAQRRETPGGP
jgi:hypothetical protein